MSIIKVSDLTFCYEGSYDNIFENVSFQLDTNWRLGLTGRNGRGKTTLLRLLQGQYPYQGTIHASVGFDYFPFDVPDAAQSPMELLARICPDVPPWRFLRELAPLEMSEDALYRPFSTLSGGEQSKLLLAMLFSRENRFLLIDEPTNHLDRTGRELVSRYLSGKKGFLLVSHTGRSWTAAWITSCPSTEAASTSNEGISPRGMRTSSGRTPLSCPRTSS